MGVGKMFLLLSAASFFLSSLGPADRRDTVDATGIGRAVFMDVTDAFIFSCQGLSFLVRRKFSLGGRKDVALNVFLRDTYMSNASSVSL